MRLFRHLHVTRLLFLIKLSVLQSYMKIEKANMSIIDEVSSSLTTGPDDAVVISLNKYNEHQQDHYGSAYKSSL